MKRAFYLVVLLLMFQFLNGQSLENGIGDTIHAIHYNIHLTEVNTGAQTITAFTEVELTPLVSNLDHVRLELKSLIVDSVFVDGISTTFTHQDEILDIQLLSAISTDDTITVKTFYHGQPFHEGWGGFHFSGDYAFNLGVGFVSIPHNLGKTWFPCIDDFTDRATYDLFVTVGDSLKAIGGGMLVETIDNGDNTQTWHWRLSKNIPTYLASVMVGDYVLHEDEFYGMEDTVPITIYTIPADTGNVAGSFVKLKAILEFFESHFGPYPFGRVGYTGTAIGAMEHAANISYPNSAINGNTGSESLYTHELSHMWFGDKVTCSSAEDMWLNEGWGTFCALYYLEVLYSHEEFVAAMREKHKKVLKETHFIDDGYWAVSNIPQVVTYGSTAYDKGSTVANTLRGYVGDSLFFDAMTAYLDHFTWQSISSADMRDFLTDYTGIDMTGFFDAWVFTEGTPHFSIDSIRVTEGDASYKVDIWLRQKYKGADFLADDNVLPVTFVDDYFNEVTDTVHFSGRTGHSVKYIDMEKLDSPPAAVFLDLYETINDATIDNFKIFATAEDYVFPETYFKILVDQLNDSALVRVTNSWVAPDSLKTPIDGLRLSGYRHWKVEGVFPENMQAGGRFFYDNTPQLDGDLILSEIDSVRILYRANPGEDWQDIPQTHVGIWSVGHIFVDELQPGEYTLAVWDTEIVGRTEKLSSEKVRIYPNPSKGKLQFEFAEKGNYTLSFYRTNGTRIDSLNVNGKRKSWKLPKNFSASEVILVRVYQGGQLIASEKVVFLQ
ncbi:MAG: M1 family metallopeptidase [Bacteroidales bacterium]|nr:M1 family metallopeptidase [Bacteroidales bacterium]MCF6342067.1 M1 family metallopeptidase [Bacteroidales bacterium]